MKRLYFLLVLMATSANAAEVTLDITLSDQDQQTFVQALDAYVKAGGINVAANAVILLQKLQAAAQVALAQPKENTK